MFEFEHFHLNCLKRPPHIYAIAFLGLQISLQVYEKMIFDGLFFLQDSSFAETFYRLHVLHQQIIYDAGRNRCREEGQVYVQQSDYRTDYSSDNCCHIHTLLGSVVVIQIFQLLFGELSSVKNEEIHNQNGKNRSEECGVNLNEQGQTLPCGRCLFIPP